jgi:hypothetical protein
MKPDRKTFILSLFIFVGISSIAAISDPIEELLKKLDRLTKTRLAEKVHLQLDKPYYSAGEDIWFKAYVMDIKTNRLTELSKVLYVDLVNPDNQPIKHLALPIETGVAWGDFSLPDTLKQGSYRIRGYTKLMNSAGQEFYFDKVVRIGNSWMARTMAEFSNEFVSQGTSNGVNSKVRFTDKKGIPYIGHHVSYEVYLDNKKTASGKLTTSADGSVVVPAMSDQPGSRSGRIVTTLTLPDKSTFTKTIPINSTMPSTDVQFFPEGGYLIQNLPNRLAFKAINNTGLGEDISGKIIDNTGMVTQRFESSHLGMGSMMFTPESGKTYTAQIKLKNGTEIKTQLPSIEKSGYSIIVNNEDTTNINIKVYTSPDLIGKGRPHLLAQKYGNIYFSTPVNTDKQINSIIIPKADFPSGIVQMNLFSPEMVPIWERCIFISNKADKVDFRVENLKQRYAKRENVQISLADANSIDTTRRGTFSVAVTNASIAKPDLENETNIMTSLLLTSDIRGKVEKPNYYFIASDAKTLKDLDNLLLTQAWRKIDWKSIDKPDTLDTKPEKGIMIAGTITNYSDKPVANGKATLFSNSNGLFHIDTTTNQNGRFSFGPLNFSDSTNFVIKALNSRGKDLNRIKLDEGAYQKPDESVIIEDNGINLDLKNYLFQNDKYFDQLVLRGEKDRSIALEAVEIKSPKPSVPNSSNFNGPGQADLVYGLNEIGNFRSFTGFIRAAIPGIEFTLGGTRGLPFVRRFTTTFNRGIPFHIYIDNVLARNDPGMTLDNQIQMSEVTSIEILTSMKYTALYGGAMGGVIVVTTRANEIGNGKYGIVSFLPKGYDKFRSFYSPRYDVENDQKTDLRSTIYWNPNLLFNKENKIDLNFYNNDTVGDYRIVIEGIDSKGKIARSSYTYQVKENL